MFHTKVLLLVFSFLCPVLIISGKSMGNITSLVRNGLQDSGTYGCVNQLTYGYDGNRLVSVSDTVTSPTYNGFFEFSDGADQAVEYEYDANGNMTRDRNKGISSIQYNADNLPLCIQYENGSRATYLYTADGTKLHVRYETSYAGLLSSGSTGGSASTAIAQTHTIDYVGNKIYEDGTLKKILVDGGYVEYNGGSPVYHAYLTDHQGNVRVVVDESTTVKQVNHYYPYGGLMAENTGSDVQPYKYNGKELDRMHGLDWYDFGARWMDAAIGRWHSMDRMCEKYYDISPYAFCKNNPINNIDINGDSIYFDMPAIEHGAITGYTRYTYGKYGDTYGFGRNGELYQGTNKTIGLISNALNKISNGGEYGRNLISFLSGNTSKDTRIKYNKEAETITLNSSKEILVHWNPMDQYGAGIDEKGGRETPPYITLSHELYHAEDFIQKGVYEAKTWFAIKNKKISYKEYDTCIKENKIRKENNLPLRKYYANYDNGTPYEPSLIK